MKFVSFLALAWGCIVGGLGGAGQAANAADSSPHTRTFTADKRYLVFPSGRGRTGPTRLSIDVEGKPYLSVADTLITATEPDHWRFIDLKLMQGKNLSVKIEGPGAAAIDLVRTSDTIPGKAPVYREPGRAQVHFSPLRGSFNDPSGMIYYQGVWHSYFANKSFNNDNGNLNSFWGHAISTDLVHWEEQPLFLPAVDGHYSFWTGGAAVDVENTTGLGKPGKPAIVYSANNGAWGPSPFTQCVFVSTDGGITARWNPEMMYKPLPKEDGRRGGGTRDPMIFWYAPEKKWVMVVFNEPPGGRWSFFFFESRDLKNWTETSVLENMLECPNLFQLPVDGNKAEMRWVIWGSPTEYLIGKFNGKAFVPDDNRRLRAHFGQYSASQVFANAPANRTVQVGWAHCGGSDGAFCWMAAFPLELNLRTTPEGLRLFADFIPELAKLRKRGSSKQKDVVVKAGTPLRVGDISQPVEIIAELDPGSASQLTFTGPELNIHWNTQNRELKVTEEGRPEGDTYGYGPDGTQARLISQNGRATLHILLDIPSVEVVTGSGDYIIKARDYRKLGEKSPMEIRAEGGDVKFSRLEVYPLKSIH
jgi:fructan beta-fructosidase